MTATVIQFTPRHNPNREAKINEVLEQLLTEIAHVALADNFHLDTAPSEYCAPQDDPA